ncbi:MFS transporter [Bombiscardovia coagulans]|uniref:Major Facilitator Superfamily n=1 Tax=Bombiscardovia coagulans TaxID=686666 RepID=A0A261EQU1_9BIFI|nr:MFS transporter [Bombiscardovia coagulans]OZG49230.1 Major Facilitator Superfamily [Bombiscardovia coagulans]
MIERETPDLKACAQTEHDPNYLPPEYPKPGKTIALILIAAVGLYIMCMSLGTALSLRIAAALPTRKDTIYSQITSVSSLLMLFFIPLAGGLSDRTTSRFGRRRPWIVGCLVVSLISAAVVGVSSNPLIMGIFYVISVVAMQAGFNAYSVIAVEGVPENRRGTVMGLMGLCGALSFSAGTYLTGALVNNGLLLMTIPIVLGLISSIPLLLLYRDPVKNSHEVPDLNLKQLFGGFFVNPRQHPNFGWTWLSRFIVGLAMASMQTYFVYYLISGLNIPLNQVGSKAGLLTLCSAPISVIFFSCSGILTDRLGRKKPFIILASIIMAVALCLGGTSHNFTQFLIAWEIFSVGQAMYLTVDLALCAEVLPESKDAGKDMGVFGLALNGANVLVPAVAPFIINTADGNNYTLLWFIAAALSLSSIIIMPLIEGVK